MSRFRALNRLELRDLEYAEISLVKTKKMCLCHANLGHKQVPSGSKELVLQHPFPLRGMPPRSLSINPAGPLFVLSATSAHEPGKAKAGSQSPTHGVNHNNQLPHRKSFQLS